MVNILTKLQENNKKLLEENQQLRIIVRDCRATIFEKNFENEKQVLKIAELKKYKEQEEQQKEGEWDCWREREAVDVAEV
ncbi:hypothetical protein Glove_144g28 [Diversispora epigaea]|uniref:Uncharacterized protein n=1 Tax=Diversispora epigaea TaxID=1348612 RepID=A0A397IX02_9GLOM|nr:hypothetical protein Glove_144g28 [Diversispora epigaea]